MDPLTRFALVGTARQREPDPAGALVDAIVAKLDLPMERRVLLAAGARAAVAMAGCKAIRSEEAFAQAPPETRRACSPKAAYLLGELFRGVRDELLPEALALLDRANQRIPHVLLPDALRIRDEPLRALVRPVLGARGAWLAALNDTWSWAVRASDATSIEELESAWTDGTPAARRVILARARAIDPPKARAWLEATWSSEKADERVALLGALRTRIGDDDEPFLETALKDRASGVRDVAQSLLPLVPASAFVQRMTARADAMLDVDASKRGLVVAPPENVDDTADRDGLLAKPPQGVGARAFWLTRAIGAVPPTHWTARFGVSAAELVAAAERTDWAAPLCEGWTRASIAHAAIASPPDAQAAIDWLIALCGFWERADEKTANEATVANMLLAIVRALPPALAAERIVPIFGGAPVRVALPLALAAIPMPWPESLAAVFIAALRDDLRGMKPLSIRVISSLPIAGRALPAASFADAFAALAFGLDEEGWERPLVEFSDVLRLRNDLVQEIVP